MEKRRILFVCLGNICRSPLGEGLLRHRATERGIFHLVETASAGTGGWHHGEPPDSRSIAVARKYGIDISAQRARQIRADDFDTYDLIFAMDRDNLRNIVRIAPHNSSADIHLFTDFTGGPSRDVPDPYYGDDRDFEHVYTMLDTGCRSLLDILFKTKASG
ncbi:MAG: low molecular weight phosphotyrosine protein phosphatase [Rhizobiaceae bacterium]|nr:MAG: low molecular weight phosphotyrosine protein phosphatase [Rhizobiaceae bacterium]